MTRLVNALEAEGLVTRHPDPGDGRITYIKATAQGLALLRAGRTRRVAALAHELANLSAADRDVLGRAATVLERIASARE
jgi:DNA-binding MarR family transcriptional regulator